MGLTIVVDNATSTDGTVQIDTSKPGTHTILYTVTDASGLTGSATRTVIVSAPPQTPPPPVNDNAATSPPANDNTASWTESRLPLHSKWFSAPGYEFWMFRSRKLNGRKPPLSAHWCFRCIYSLDISAIAYAKSVA